LNPLLPCPWCIAHHNKLGYFKFPVISISKPFPLDLSFSHLVTAVLKSCHSKLCFYSSESLNLWGLTLFLLLYLQDHYPPVKNSFNYHVKQLKGMIRIYYYPRHWRSEICMCKMTLGDYNILDWQVCLKNTSPHLQTMSSASGGRCQSNYKLEIEQEPD